MQFNEWIRPSCLPYSLPDSGPDGKATATGWGDVEWRKYNNLKKSYLFQYLK